MGFFDSIQKPGFKAAQAKNSHIIQDVIKTSSDPRRSPNPFVQRLQSRPLNKKQPTKSSSTKATPSPRPRAQNPRKRPAITQQRLESDSDDDVSDQDLSDSRKRTRRTSDVEPDLKRQIRSRKAFSDETGGEFNMVHASHIASLSKPVKFKAAFPDHSETIDVQLQYPSASQREKYVPLRTVTIRQLTTPGTSLLSLSRMMTLRP